MFLILAFFQVNPCPRHSPRALLMPRFPPTAAITLPGRARSTSCAAPTSRRRSRRPPAMRTGERPTRFSARLRAPRSTSAFLSPPRFCVLVAPETRCVLSPSGRHQYSLFSHHFCMYRIFVDVPSSPCACSAKAIVRSCHWSGSASASPTRTGASLSRYCRSHPC
jgi:hypothetical protein